MTVIPNPLACWPTRRRTTAPPAMAGPDAVEVAARRLRIGEGVCRSFAVTGYPREVGPGWLEPLLTHPARLDVAVHVEALPQAVAADRLRRQLARLESERRLGADKGHLADPHVEAAADDAADLADRIARGEGRLHRVGLYVTVHARRDEDLDAEADRVRSLAASLLLDAQPATFRSLQGFTTTLPLAVDTLRTHRTMDTAALAAGFPFTSPDLPDSGGGVLYGVNVNSAGLAVWDRWACDNYNSVLLARSGAGKSYLAKLEILRSLYQGVEVAVVDPEDEYQRLADAVGGAYLHLGAPGVRVNPLDLPPVDQATPDTLARRALFCHTFIGVLLGGPLEATARAALDRAIIAAYAHAGINTDPRTWARPAPLLSDLAAALHSDDDPAARTVAARLAPYVTGSHKGLFDAATTTRPDGHLVVWCLRDLPDELHAAGTLLALDAIWRHVANPAQLRRRLVVVDEAWLLMRHHEGARWLFRLAKSARKHWTGLTVVTQDAADLLGSDLGRAVVANATTQILLRQAPQAIDQVGDAFRLSAGERELLVAADRGEGLLAAGAAHRVAFRAVASAAEHRLVTTDPAELADLDTTPDRP